jgi:hypothetical protein
MKKILLIALIGITIISCKKEGCTDRSAVNFDEKAKEDDGSCIFDGCTDPLAFNYSANATNDDGSCTYEGCTDPNAVNYDPNATVSSVCTYDQVGSWTSTMQETTASVNASSFGITIYDTSYTDIAHPDSISPSGLDFLSSGILVSHYHDQPSDTGSWVRSNNDLTMSMMDTSLVFNIDTVNSTFLRLTSNFTQSQTDNSSIIPVDISLSVGILLEFNR